MKLPSEATIVDVVCRDGFQNEKEFIPTAEKIKIVNKLSQAGFKRLQVTSFVSPKAVPQMRDAAEVVTGIERKPGIVYTALTPNIKGASAAIEAGVDALDVFLSASESHNKANVRMSIADSIKAVKEVIALAEKHNKAVMINVATSFGCPFEGVVPRENLYKIAGEFLAIDNVEGVVIADTTGMANPKQVYELTAAFKDKFAQAEIYLHFHNTRNMAMANILAGLQAGVSNYECSLGGLGGCPFAPGASGNVPTEDVVSMLGEMGVNTGIDLGELISTANYLEKIIGRALPGQVMKAGRVCDLHPLPEI